MGKALSEEKNISYAAGREDLLLQRILDVGDLMLQSGAEINRVEDTLARLGTAYGATMDVYCIIYSIVVTMQLPDGKVLTQTRRVFDRDDMDFDRLDRLNDLSRRGMMRGNWQDYIQVAESIKEVEARIFSI